MYFIDTRGNPNLGVAICDRCKFKYASFQLTRDPNTPGLRVCSGCKDVFDPWRLPARQPERVTLPFVRPDIPLQDSIPIPITEVIAKRLVTEDGRAILTEDGQYIVAELPPELEPD